MSLSIKLQKKRILKATKPVYAALDGYYDQLQTLLRAIRADEDAEHIALAIEKLPLPTNFLPGSLRVKKNQQHPLPARR